MAAFFNDSLQLLWPKVGDSDGAATMPDCTVGIVERGLEDLRTGETRLFSGDVRVRDGDARLDGEVLGRPGDLLETVESILAAGAVLLLPPTAFAERIEVLVFVGTVSTSFLELPLVVRRGLSIFNYFSYM